MKSLFLSLLLVPGFIQAQRWHVNLAGVYPIIPEICRQKHYTFDQSYFAFGAGAQYDITRNFSVISNIRF